MKKSLVNLIIIFIAGVLVGLIIGWFFPQKFKSNNQLAENLSSNYSDKNISQIVVDNFRGQVGVVEKQAVKFIVKQLAGTEIITTTKVAQINSETVLYLLTPKTVVDSQEEAYQKKLSDIKEQMKQAVTKKDIKKLNSLKEDLKTVTLANSDNKNKQIEALSKKINSLPIGSAEREEARIAFMELTSAFKYSKITLDDIKSGDAIQAWAKNDLTNQDKFVATRIEIKR